MKNKQGHSLKQMTNINNNNRLYSPVHTNNEPYVKSLVNSKQVKKRTFVNSPYQKTNKQFQSNQNAHNNKISQYLYTDSNKFRIVTEPVDDRIAHFKNTNLFSSSLATKNTNKIETEIRQTTTQMRLNLRQSDSRLRDRVYSNVNIINKGDDGYKSGERSQKNKHSAKDRNATPKCANCRKLMDQLEYIQQKVSDITKKKDLWKSGEITFEEIKNMLSKESSPVHNDKQIICFEKGRSSSLQQNSYKKGMNHEQKFGDKVLNEIKFHFSDFIAEIQSLAMIDYPKMLQMQVFKYEPNYQDFIDTQQDELKELLQKLRMTFEGKTIDYDTFDSDSENSYTKTIMRNLTSRLNASLRLNLQLKIYKVICQKSQMVSHQNEEYLREIIEDVIKNYVDVNKCRKKEMNEKRRKGQK